MAEITESVILTPAEVAALSPEDKAIYDEIEAGRKALPAKQAADKVIRDKAAAEGRPLTFQEASQLNYPTTDDQLGVIGAGPKGTVYNPLPTGKAAEKGPDNQEALRFGIYQEYLRQWNYGKRDYATKQLLEPGAEPMTFEEFIPAFSAIDGDQSRIGELTSFNKGQGAAAAASGGVSTPGMFSNQQSGGQYTTMGSPIAGSSANIRNPYKPGTQQYEDFKDRRSAYDLLYSEFKQYGLESLVEPLKGLITSGVSKDEFTLRLRETEPYKKRFAANEIRIKNGLRALSESDYIQNEDLYQEVMRRRGLPPEYYAKGDLGVQKGFESLLAGDVSSTELEDRIVTAQDRVLNANPEVAATLKEFYPGISNGDILAYTLDPANAINAIKRKITAAEIGGAAAQSGLQTNVARAEELTAAGVNKAAAQEGFGTIAGGLQRGSQLASIYGEDPYTQTTAEQEVFGLAGKTEARKQRQKVTGLERATFGGQSGLTSGALARDRAGGY